MSDDKKDDTTLHVIGPNGEEVGQIGLKELADTYGASIRAGLASASWSASKDGLVIDVSGACPVQGEGSLDGHPLYFRARHDGWSFCVAASLDGDPVDVGFGSPGWYLEGSYGLDEEASWMPASDSMKIVEACVARIRKEWLLAGKASAPIHVPLELGVDVPKGPSQ